MAEVVERGRSGDADKAAAATSEERIDRFGGIRSWTTPDLSGGVFRARAAPFGRLGSFPRANGLGKTKSRLVDLARRATWARTHGKLKSPDPVAADSDGEASAERKVDLEACLALPRPSRPITVLQVIPTLDGGDIQRECVSAAKAVEAEGGRALVFSAGGTLANELSDGVNQVMPVGSKNPLRIAWNGFRLALICRWRKVDVIHAHSAAAAWAGLIATSLSPARLVTKLDEVGSERALSRRVGSVAAASGDRVVACSKWAGELLHARHRLPEDRIVIIRGGVDVERFDARDVAAERTEALKTRWRLPFDAGVVLISAPVSRGDGQDLFVDAAALLRDDPQAPQACFVVVGRDRENRLLRRELGFRVNAKGLDDVVRFAGVVDDLPAAYALADVVVAGSGDDAWAILEAQAMGRPVVAPNLRPHREAMRAEPDWPKGQTTGLTYRVGDAAALANAIKAAIQMPVIQHAAMGYRGAVWMRRERTAARMTADTLALYREVARLGDARAEVGS